MRRYESVVILDPDMAEDDIRTFTDRYSEVISSYGGEIIKVDDWGIKRLAYLVKKRDKGRYILFDFAGNPVLIDELERQFKISEEVMKFLSVKLDSDVDIEALKAAAEAKAAAEERSAAEEAAPTQVAEAPPTDTAAEAKPEEESAQPQTPAEEATVAAVEEPAAAEQPEALEKETASEAGKEAETK